MTQASQLKEKANALYANGDYSQALRLYNEAIDAQPEDNKLLATVHKNAAACNLKLVSFCLKCPQYYLIRMIISSAFIY